MGAREVWARNMGAGGARPLVGGDGGARGSVVKEASEQVEVVFGAVLGRQELAALAAIRVREDGLGPAPALHVDLDQGLQEVVGPALRGIWGAR